MTVSDEEAALLQCFILTLVQMSSYSVNSWRNVRRPG